MAVGSKSADGLNTGKPDPDTGKVEISRPSPGVADYIAGEAKQFVGNLSPYLPQELIGGTIPHIPGTEEEAVWNAASQACGTEKVHFCYALENKKVYYLACPSYALASNPDSWCPLAAALPGNSEYWDKETVYLYEQEGQASALRWDPETGRMQVFLGASRTILPRIQSMDANFVTINPEVADIVPWNNRNLKTEKLSRATVRGLLFSGILVAMIAALVLVYSFISINMLDRDLQRVKLETEQATTNLMLKANGVMKSDTVKHMVNIQTLLDKLAKVDGTLVKYEVQNNSLQWEALIPKAFTGEFPRAKVLPKVEADGRVRIQGTRL